MVKNKRKKTRMTKQRKAILKVLKSTKSHPTADWVYEQVKEEIPNISLGTVYRNLNVLAEMGKIMVLDYGSTYSRYDGNPENHYHFKCLECGRVYDVDIPVKESLNKEVNENTAFKVTYHRTEFYGVCPECQNKN
ncbi:Fur family transcriptional regulator [Halothermothrix orenii]|uniref:Ferric uptake regulator, Fur family n=1 Tax=Halothermothrix orenii (strain H 168 / OCM 544 / DSM 9562) TaxID=373903 RepID=B8CWI3_HALOH|nr:transcriptional repressor [Halothermothrix orenii]ACL69652.1 ferric uptake regulator, Fur family [Halothermothrix orenii H 168]